MEPTPEQILELTDVYFKQIGSSATICNVIKRWEAIRPQEDIDSLNRSRDAWKANCATLSQRVVELEKERDELKAMLPEWIPVSDMESGCGKAYLISFNDDSLDLLPITAVNLGAAWCMDLRLLANLPRREPAKIEPEDNESLREEIRDLREQLEREHERLMEAQRHLAGKCEEDFS